MSITLSYCPDQRPDYIPVLIGLAPKFGVKAYLTATSRVEDERGTGPGRQGLFLPINPTSVIDILHG